MGRPKNWNPVGVLGVRVLVSSSPGAAGFRWAETGMARDGTCVLSSCGRQTGQLCLQEWGGRLGGDSRSHTYLFVEVRVWGGGERCGGDHVQSWGWEPHGALSWKGSRAPP